MSVIVHLLLLVLMMFAVVVTVLCDWGPGARRAGEVLRGAVPVLFVGLLCSLLMLAGSKPLLEWLVPLAGVLLIGGLCKSDRVFRAARLVAPVVAAALAIHFVNVAHRPGLTNAPDVLARLSRLRESIAKNDASKQLLSTFDAEQEFPAGPVSSMLGQETMSEPVDVQRAVAEWHTVLSRLYGVEHRRGTVWYPGGKIGEASQHLEVRVP